MGYDQGAVGVPSYRPVSVLVEPTTSRRPVFVCARSPPIRGRVRRPTHAAVRRHIVRVSLRIPPHLSRPLAPPTSDTVGKCAFGPLRLLSLRLTSCWLSAGIGPAKGFTNSITSDGHRYHALWSNAGRACHSPRRSCPSVTGRSVKPPAP